MKYLTFFAHAGEHHETTAEAAQHAVNSGVTISTPVLFWLALMIVPIILLGIMQLLRWKLPTKLLVISTFLILFSVISYQAPGVYSVIALGVGFAIVLVQTMVGLSANEQ